MKKGETREKGTIKLRRDPKNANKGTGRGRYLVRDSLRDYGAGRSIVADKNGVVIAGNKTLEAAEEEKIPIREVHTKGEELVVVVRDDLDLEVDKKARELAYADNRSNEVGLEWDTEQLISDMDAGIELGKFWQESELEEVLKLEDDKGADDAGNGGPPRMELQPLESYDYVLVLARNTMDFQALCSALEIGPVNMQPAGMKPRIGLGRCIDAAKVLEKLKG